MKTDEKQKKAGLSSSAASRLVDAESEIVAIWEDRVRELIPSAEDQSSQIIKNSLPSFLVELAKVLAGNGETDACTKNSCKEHGEQRAEKTHYSAEQVAHEYLLLGEVIFEVMEKTTELDLRARHLIKANIDRGIAVAVASFTRRMGEEPVE
ncbi:MAG: RsbRD N-terminal domain-containing protein [Bdellovibrionota bacterium]